MPAAQSRASSSSSSEGAAAVIVRRRDSHADLIDATDVKKHRPESTPSQLTDRQRFFAIAEAIDEAVDQSWAAPFWVPVDEERDGAPAYYAKVRDPVSVEHIMNRLERGVYSDVPQPPISVKPKSRARAAAVMQLSEGKCTRSLRRDIELFVVNSTEFNGADHSVTDLARRLLAEIGAKVFPLLQGSSGDAPPENGPVHDAVSTADVKRKQTPAQRTACSKAVDPPAPGVAASAAGAGDGPVVNTSPEDLIRAAIETEKVFGGTERALTALVRWCREHGVRPERVSSAHCGIDLKRLSAAQLASLAELRKSVA